MIDELQVDGAPDEPECCEREAEQGAEHRHHANFDQQLSEDLPPARAERATDASHRRAVQELGEQQPDGVDQAK